MHHNGTLGSLLRAPAGDLPGTRDVLNEKAPLCLWEPGGEGV